MNEIFSWIVELPPVVAYLVLGVGAAIENVVPAIPADTFVAVGGFLAARGPLDWRWLLLATWLCNVVSAVAMYRVGYTHGRPFFADGWGARLLNKRQMERMGAFYDRWGAFAIFFTRFLPGLRSVVPIFAGVTHQPALFVALPIAIASAIWYGALVWIGMEIARNLDSLRAALSGLNAVLAGVAVVVALGAGIWWYRSRRAGRDE